MAKTILLADDSVTIQKVVELTFMDQDYEVVAVSDGRAAQAKLAEMRPDLLIADVHMPEANGYEVCRQAKQTHPGLPVLLLVGTFEPFDLQQANAAGADSHLKKPFDSQDLLREVDTLISQSAPPPALTAPVEEAVPTAPASPAVPQAAPPQPTPPQPTPPQPTPPQPTPPQPTPPASAAPQAPPRMAVPQPTPQLQGSASPPQTSSDVGLRVAPEPPAPEPPAPREPVTFTDEPPPASEPESVELEPEGVAVEEVAAAGGGPATGNGSLSDEDVDRIARRVVDIIGDSVVRQVAWEVIPDLAEVVIKERLKELESQVE